MSLLSNNLNQEERDALSQANLPDSLREKLQEAGFGAHNQKSRIEIKVELHPELQASAVLAWILNIAAKAASSITLSALKRPDEKYITEMSYGGFFIDENFKMQRGEGRGPKFVEDIARQAAESLHAIVGGMILDFVVVVNNEESIHSNDIAATAILTAGGDLK
jgi:GTP cyclohydrolase I